MTRRGKREQDFDDSLEQSHVAKRLKASTAAEAPPDDDAAAAGGGVNSNRVATTVGEKLERLRAKKERRKERKKEKAERRRQHQQALAQERRELAKALDEKREEQKERREVKKRFSEKQAGGGFVKTRKGVQYQDVIMGQGPEVRLATQIQVKYTLRAKPGGRVIDSSNNFGAFLGKGQVIEGWDIGMEGMRQGGVRHLVVPPQAGYGQKDIGAGKGAILYFEIKLLAC